MSDFRNNQIEGTIKLVDNQFAQHFCRVLIHCTIHMHYVTSYMSLRL